MNIFKIERGYRQVGLNFGLPCFTLDFGPGVNYSLEALMKKLADLGLRSKGLVVLRGDTRPNMGSPALVEALRFTGCKSEVEYSGDWVTPGWFPQVDNWMVRWVERGKFNYGALRRQDMVVCGPEELEGMLVGVASLAISRGLLLDGSEDMWEKVKDMDVRVYHVV